MHIPAVGIVLALRSCRDSLCAMRQLRLAVLSGFDANDVARVSAALEAAGVPITGEFGEHERRMLEVRHAAQLQ